MGHNTYTVPGGVKRDNVTPIKVPVLKDNMDFHYKRDSLNVISQILTKKIINNLKKSLLMLPE